ncbi:exodeoxyribonuclease VII large subunit, partial [bacterium]|nr:exodeoxyribonuclease VII large subunit [bacterium]
MPDPQQDTAARSELSVSDVTRRVKGLIEGAEDLRGVWVRGEVSNVRLAGSGHLYFTLKDAASELRVAYFRYGAKRREPPGDGKEVLVHGDVRLYERRGEYQLVADDIIKVGVGDLAARFEALKRKLHEEGLFGEERKLDPPAVPRRIALITGVATAALQDVLKVLKRRAPYVSVVLFPSSVQGEGAPAELTAALAAADECPGVEVILLVRGGGSIEDLWCFNDEGLARMLAEVKRPVITGVGHEIDYTIVDFIADRRAPTPSSAAEMVAPDAAELRANIGERSNRLSRAAAQQISERRESLARLFDHRLLRDVVGAMEHSRQGVDELAANLVEETTTITHGPDGLLYEDLLGRMSGAADRGLERWEHELHLFQESLLRAGRHRFEDLQAMFSVKERELKARDPRAPK